MEDQLMPDGLATKKVSDGHRTHSWVSIHVSYWKYRDDGRNAKSGEDVWS
jgi:hypothetical protein